MQTEYLLCITNKIVNLGLQLKSRRQNLYYLLVKCSLLPIGALCTVHGNTLPISHGRNPTSLQALAQNHPLPPKTVLPISFLLPSFWRLNWSFLPQNSLSLYYSRASLVAQMVKHLPATQATQLQCLGWEEPLGKGMATHSSILTWRIPWTEEHEGLESMGLQRVGYNWAANTFTFILLSQGLHSNYTLYYLVSSPHLPSHQFSRSGVSDSLQPHGLQHARPPCPSPTPRVYSNSCPLSQWCHPTI